MAVDGLEGRGMGARAAGVAAMAALATLAACNGGNAPSVQGQGAAEESTQERASAGPAFDVRTVASGLEHPWGMAFLPDGRALVTERPGRLRVVGQDGRVGAPLRGLPPGIVERGQGGLLDVALDPDFARNRRIYLSYSEGGEPGGANGTAVWRAELDAQASALTKGTVIFRQRPKVDSSGHFGSRLVFDRQGHLFVTLGDRMSRSADAQNLSNHLGKVVRITTEGKPAPGNAMAGQAGAAPEVWSWGHRNVQGAALHPQTGVLWTSEHGPQGGDEVNVTKAGRNYGWPVITYGCTYGLCQAIGDGTAKEGMEQPLAWWPKPSTAPSGLVFYDGDRFPAWKGSLFMGALAGERLWRLSVEGERITGRQELLADQGERIRDVEQGPDGWLYLLTDAPDGKLLRLQSPSGG